MSNEQQENIAAIFGASIVVGIILFMIILWVNAMPDDVDKVRSGEFDLICIMKDGERLIDREKVIDRIDETWLFKDGSAKNCRMVKGV